MSSRDSVQIPDDRDFDQFRTECNSEAGWHLTYHRSGIAVWIQMLEAEKSLHKIKDPLLRLSDTQSQWGKVSHLTNQGEKQSRNKEKFPDSENN